MYIVLHACIDPYIASDTSEIFDTKEELLQYLNECSKTELNEIFNIYFATDVTSDFSPYLT